jgi:hypothetical protein
MLLCRQTHRDAKELLKKYRDPLCNKLRLYVIKKSWKIKPGIGYSPPKHVIGSRCKTFSTYDYSFNMVGILIGKNAINFKRLTERNPLILYIWHKYREHRMEVWGFCSKAIDKIITMFKKELDYMLMLQMKHMEE